MSTQGQGDVNEWTFAACLKVAQTGYGEWALNPRNDTATEHLAGTVIVSDMMVCIAEAFQRALSSSRGEQGWRTMDSAPTDGTHIIGNTQWGAREIWWHKDTYEGEYWTDEGDSEPEPTGWIPMPGPVPASLAGQVPDGAKEDTAAAYFRSAIADGQAAILLADLATYDNVLRELGIQESHKHPVDEVRRIQRIAETAHPQGVEAAAKLIDRKVSDYTSEHGSLDPETGAMEFSRSGEEYVSTLEELAEEIRGINTAAPQPTAGGDAPTPADERPEDYNCPKCGDIIHSRAHGIEGADCSCVKWEGPK